MRASPELVEVDDIGAFDSLPHIATAKAPSVPREAALDDTVEIELTAEQMDALLSGR